jgi:hypothetical protein
VCREKKIERNLHLAIFSELYLPYIYHPVLITNFIHYESFLINIFKTQFLLRVFVKLFYSLKINKKHKYNQKNLVLLDGLLSKIGLLMFHI